MSALRMLAWGAVDEPASEDKRIFLETEVQKELPQYLRLVYIGDDPENNTPQLTYKLLADTGFSTTNEGEVWRMVVVSGLRTCCGYAMKYIERANHRR